MIINIYDNKCLKLSKETGKKLLVIGDPNIFPVNLGFIETGTIQKFNSPSLDN